jgi:hypothetical protein
MDMGEKKTCVFSCYEMYIKFDIDISNDELLKTIWKIRKKKEKLIIIGNA